MSSAKIAEIPTVVEESKAFAQLLETNRQLKLLFAGQILRSAQTRQLDRGTRYPGALWRAVPTEYD